MSHSYEEVRSVIIDILAGREVLHSTPKPEQFDNLLYGVAEVFYRRSHPGEKRQIDWQSLPRHEDAELVREVFWDLFRQGIITLGLDNANRQFPWFKVSTNGRRILEDQSGYFFHDVSTYTRLIQNEVPTIDATTLVYLQEAMQAFQSGCILSATVMLGVASEHTFTTVAESIAAGSYGSKFAPVLKEQKILPMANKFKKIVDAQTLPGDVKEDLDTRFAGILSIIRTFRNESGHPTGKIIDREQAFVLLQLFIPYCKKMYQLMQHFQ